MVQLDTILSQSLVLSLPGIYFFCISKGRGWGLMERESLFNLVKHITDSKLSKRKSHTGVKDFLFWVWRITVWHGYFIDNITNCTVL